MILRHLKGKSCCVMRINKQMMRGKEGEWIDGIRKDKYDGKICNAACMCSCYRTDTDTVFIQTDFFHFSNISNADSMYSICIAFVNKQAENIAK